MNGVAMSGQLRGHFRLNFLQRWIGVAGVEVRESALGAVEQAAGAFEGNDGVLERRLVGKVRERIHFLELLAHAGLHGRDEVFIFDFVERWQVIRQRTFNQERILDRRRRSADV